MYLLSGSSIFILLIQALETVNKETKHFRNNLSYRHEIPPWEKLFKNPGNNPPEGKEEKKSREKDQGDDHQVHQTKKLERIQHINYYYWDFYRVNYI